jgi:hypothetical protein
MVTSTFHVKITSFEDHIDSKNGPQVTLPNPGLYLDKEAFHMGLDHGILLTKAI